LNDSQYKSEFQRALSLRNGGQLERAREAFQVLRSVRPEEPTAAVVLGGILLDLGLHDAAFDSFRDATRLRPRSELASLGVFHSLWDARRTIEALAEMRRFLTVSDCADYREIIRELWDESMQRRGLGGALSRPP
jgi:predicted Zn-dependent protease